MNIHAMYWSATGTTEKVVRAIAQAIAGQEKIAIHDFTLPQAREQSIVFAESDAVIFGTPVYAGRVPNVLLKYLATVQGNGALAVPVVLFGNRDYDDALIELRDILEANGFHTIAGAAFVGEHAFSRTLAAGRPDAQDMQIAEDFAMQVKTRLDAGNPQTPAPVAGQTPVRPYYTPRDRAGNPVNILKVKPKTDMEKCDHCGICATVCPMGSIDRQQPDSIHGICIKCCACQKKCPKDAKYFDDSGYLYHKEELELGYARRAQPALFL